MVGVFLFVAGGTGGAWAVTFKDGKISKDNQVEEPAQQVERKSTGGFLGQLFGFRIAIRCGGVLSIRRFPWPGRRSGLHTFLYAQSNGL